MLIRNNNLGDYVIYFVYNLLYFLLNVDLMYFFLFWFVSLFFSMMSIVLELYVRGSGLKVGKDNNYFCYK